MDVHLSLNSESELGENYGFFYISLVFDKKYRHNKTKYGHIRRQSCSCAKKYVHMYLSKTNSETNQKNGHIKK